MTTCNKRYYWNPKWYKIIKIRNFSQVRESLLWDEISENLISHYYFMYNTSIMVIVTRITCLKVKSRNMQNRENYKIFLKFKVLEKWKIIKGTPCN